MKKWTFFLFLVLYSVIISSQSLKLMTFNIRLNTKSDGENAWPKRSDYLTSQILFYEPDIIGIQEALPEQVNDLDLMLSGYKHFGAAREGYNKGEASSIFYNESRLALFDQGTFWLSETPDTVSKGWDAACHRVCSYGLFYDKIFKKFVWVFNTHLDHIGEIARSKGLELIIKRISGLNTNNYPVVLMGDFNSAPETDRIKRLKNIMFDCKELSISKPFGPDATFNGFKFCEEPRDRIDYIFLSENSKYIVTKYAVLTDNLNLKYSSDHFPVYVELKYVE